MAAAFRVKVDRIGGLPPLAGIFPDQMAPMVRNGPDRRQLAMLRLGLPQPPNVSRNRPVINIRNTASSFQRAWMKSEHRCLVPVISCCGYQLGKSTVPRWFAMGEDCPRFALAGLWRLLPGSHAKTESEYEIFAFLTTEPNAVLAQIQLRAMPVLPTITKEYDVWLTAPVEDALALQRTLPDGALMIVARGAKYDG